MDPLASLLGGVALLWGVGILEGLPRWAGPRGEGRPWSATFSEASEQTDWMSEMSKSDASLPRRLLPRLPGWLGVLLSGERNAIRAVQCILYIIHIQYKDVLADSQKITMY